MLTLCGNAHISEKNHHFEVKVVNNVNTKQIKRIKMFKCNEISVTVPVIKCLYKIIVRDNLSDDNTPENGPFHLCEVFYLEKYIPVYNCVKM